MRIIMMLVAMLALSGCYVVKESAQRVNSNVRYEADKSYFRLKEYTQYSRTPQPVVDREMAPSYCYQVLNDVLCYNEPQYGRENTLVAEQAPIVVTSNVPLSAFPRDRLVWPWDKDYAAVRERNKNGDPREPTVFVSSAPVVSTVDAPVRVTSSSTMPAPASSKAQRRSYQSRAGVPQDLMPTF